MILPSLPLSGFLLLLLFILGWQEYFWPFVASIGPERMTLSVALVRLVQATAGLRPGLLAAGVSLLVAPMGLLLFVALVLFQFLYLDRLVLYAKRRQGKDF